MSSVSDFQIIPMFSWLMFTSPHETQEILNRFCFREVSVLRSYWCYFCCAKSLNWTNLTHVKIALSFSKRFHGLYYSFRLYIFFIIIFKRISIYPTEKSLKADKIASASYASARCYNSNKYKRINLVSPLPGLRTARYASERTPRLCFLISASSLREGCGGRDAGASCLSLWKIANH